jgi:hypothetical protein
MEGSVVYSRSLQGFSAGIDAMTSNALVSSNWLCPSSQHMALRNLSTNDRLHLALQEQRSGRIYLEVRIAVLCENRHSN